MYSTVYSTYPSGMMWSGWSGSPTWGMPFYPSNVYSAPPTISNGFLGASYPQETLKPRISRVQPRSVAPSLSVAQDEKNTSSDKVLKYLPIAGLLFANALLLNRLPALNRPGANLLPTDWKVWARVALGILSVSNLNKAFDWKPPPWLAGMETVAVIHPLTSGVSRHSLGQLFVIAPMVAGIVQAASFLHQSVNKELKEEYGVPSLISRLAISVGMVVLGVKLFPKIHKPLLQSALFQKLFPKSNFSKTGSVLANTMTTCARGCTPGGIICLSEVGELLGGMGSWFKAHPGLTEEKKSQWS